MAVRVETSDRLEGHPARLWENLLKFRNYKESKRNLSSLTDLRQLDEDDIGSFALLLSSSCGLTPSDSRGLAERIVVEAGELYRAIYGTESP